MWKAKYVLAVLVCILAPFLRASPLQNDPSFTYLSTRIGLSQDQINDIVIDKDGFVWVATEGGLDRWDGYKVENITGPEGIFANAGIAALAITNDSKLWISTASRGIYVYDLEENSFTQVIAERQRDGAIWLQNAENFSFDTSGNLIIPLYEDVYRYDVNSGKIDKVFALPDDMLKNGKFIRDATISHDTVFVATNGALLSRSLRSDNSPIIAIPYLKDEQINLSSAESKFLKVDKENNLWVGTLQGAYMASMESVMAFLNGIVEKPAFTTLLPNRNVWELKWNEDGQIWAGTDQGLYRLTQTGSGDWNSQHLLRPHNGQTELSRKDIRSLEQDKEGNLWLGTFNAGALYWSPKSMEISVVQNYRNSQTQNLSDSNVWSFYQPDENTLWVGTENGLNRLDLSSGKTEAYLVQNADNGVRDETTIDRILPGPDSTLLLDTYMGMRKFNPGSYTLSKYPFNDAGGQLEDVYTYGSALDDKGRLYFIGNAFYRYDFTEDKLETLPIPTDVLDPLFANTFVHAPARYKNKIFLSMSNGVWLIDTETMEYQHIYVKTGGDSDYYSVSNLVLQDDTLWIADPRNGLIALNADTFAVKRVLDKQTVLQTNLVYSLQADREDGLWFSSHNGLHRYSTLSNTVRHFKYGQELNVSEFNEGAGLALADGRLVYGSTNGIVLFDPLKLSGISKALKTSRVEMAITGIQLDSRPYQAPRINLSGRHLMLNHDDFGLTIRYSPLLMSMTSDSLFHYRLMREQQIVAESITHEGSVTFGSLEPGEYTFTVGPAGRNMEFAVIPAQIRISMPYAPYRSPLALSIYALALLGLVLLYFWRRQRELVNLERTQQQVRLFSDAFRQTRDWVIIFDDNREPVAANPTFLKAFSLSPEEKLSKQINRLYQQFPKLKRQLSGRLHNLQPGEYWKDEDTIIGVDGRPHDVLIDITAVTNPKNTQETEHYLLVISDISEQKEAERKLIKLANYDNLTGLVNRSLLLDRLEHAIANAEHHKTKVAVLFVDLDRFKGINDSLGHDYGDKLLKVIANRMRNLASTNDTVARLGGDEFVIVMEEIHSPDSLSMFIGQLIESVETPISLGKEVLRVSCSVGVAFYPDDARQPAELLKQADVAMYSAKKDTVNGFTYFTREMNDKARQRLQLENRVKLAYTDGGFYNHYQPVINTATGRMEGVELLLRCHIKDQPLYPDKFIPVLEELRYIIEVTRQAIERAVEDLTHWYSKGFTGYVSVNLSALHFKTEFDINGLLALLSRYSLPASALRFEITEGVLMDDTDNTLRQLKRFVEAGFILALDDFGTGYSSLSYLQRYPLQMLKIDKSFVDDLTAQGNHALVMTTITLADNLKMMPVAEGVESQEQARILHERGCQYHQGYYYSRPVEARAIEPLLAKHWSIDSPDELEYQKG